MSSNAATILCRIYGVIIILMHRRMMFCVRGIRVEENAVETGEVRIWEEWRNG
jgi:hypothetical protein